jgi:hypothetical protein
MVLLFAANLGFEIARKLQTDPKPHSGLSVRHSADPLIHFLSRAQVSDLMFRAYGDERYLCLPFVIAMNSSKDAEQAFDTLERYLALTEPPRLPTLADCENEELPLDDVVKMAQYCYNACINRIGGIYGPSPGVSRRVLCATVRRRLMAF